MIVACRFGGSATMRAAWYERTGPAREVLVVGEMPAPEPGPRQVRVALKTSGVNPSDVKARAGSRPMLASRIIPQSDGGGVIERVGSGVPNDRVGQRVWVWNGQCNRPLGTCAQFITVAVEQASPMPDPLTFEEAACLGIPALTAYRALATDGGVQDKIVLVAGGAGAVGHYAVQMAKLMGAEKVITTVSTPAKADHARAAGADEIINYRTENVAERINVLTHGHGVDRIVEVDIAGNAGLYPAIMARDGLIAASPATFAFVLAGEDRPASEGELRTVGDKWERRQGINARRFRGDGNSDIAVATDWYVRKRLLRAFPGMYRVEVDRKQVAELKQFVILEQPALLNP